MKQNLIRKVLKIGGMTCSGCERRIEAGLRGRPGVKSVKASFSRASVEIAYDPAVISIRNIIGKIEKLDYVVKDEEAEDKFSSRQLIGIGLILLAGYLIIKSTVGFNYIPALSQNMGYGILFAVGLITSFHCIAMCGGINLSQCLAYSSPAKARDGGQNLLPSLFYNAGRVLSYTLVGGVVGGLGSVLSFSGAAKGAVAILSGFFMVVMGLNMLNLFPWLRRLNPRLPGFFSRSVSQEAGSAGKYRPFYVGMLNGLMPCGPLQAMQIYALGTGSVAAGAAAMFVFSLGTVPLMFGLGAVSAFLSGKFTHKMMKAGGVLVILLGAVMLSRGAALSGLSLTAPAAPAATGNVAQLTGDRQEVTTALRPGSYPPITVQKGVPVKWIIQAGEGALNGCNRTLVIPQYNITKTLTPGYNEIVFTPEEEGTIVYSCWMGMIRSRITVVAES